MTLTISAEAEATARPVRIVSPDCWNDGLDDASRAYCAATGFDGKSGTGIALPGSGGVSAYLFAASESAPATLFGKLGQGLPPAGAWAVDPATRALTADQAACIALGAYRFSRYTSSDAPERSLAVGAVAGDAQRIASACGWTRDLVNTPANDMSPDDLQAAALSLADAYGATLAVTAGTELETGFPMIHAVGRAASVAPRLIDLTWGDPSAPKVTLVGKGVCFDSGGLDIKPASGMLLMKKDMGGAAHVLGLARMIMAAGRKLRLRVLIPAVENAISGHAFRPGDVLKSRKGDTVEIGNTDAEGRLVLADALTLACEENPDLLIDMATLTGAARVALGPDVVPFYTDDDALAASLATAGVAADDPMWRMPLHKPYAAKLSSRIADTSNVTTDGFAGSVTAALFLQRFVAAGIAWAHFDIYAWTQTAKPACPVGAEAQVIRALDRLLAERYR